MPFCITNGEAQKAQLSAVTLGFKVVEAPQFVHFTVLIVCFSSWLILLLTNSSYSISSTVNGVSEDLISFCAPQYLQAHFSVPGAYLSNAPQSLHFNSRLIS